MQTTSRSILVMGVSGSGKSHIGRDVASAIGAEFIDADDHHSPTSIAKMSRGEPLTDTDREGWLNTLSNLYRQHREIGHDLVIGCSALKHHYRDVLRRGAPDLKILYLHGERDVLLSRLNSRGGHFFAGEHMLDSQLGTLEPPGEDEAFRVDIREKPDRIVARFIDHLNHA
ncbi:gluconokinase [Modicisalibacter tunisiensis]|uniref:Gluconokinase n=1 Tax=Modicisalibacter tunisiensis TaxID=390637 RepID=A0ABS7X2X6_9GAMM|nr:gluconokinase [Modicisalibacter tunisiensis]MBZ9537330.1 gluconokinase [Modicisalibacter tunisiensis]MBZ9569248.1 gluconokinase [Modicisalibacter tunisiensis]